jgi:glycosyltransferase involved in cell wall biosynthesis
VAFKYAKALADVADVVVVTQIRNRANIEKVGCGRAQIEYLDTEAVAAPISKLANFLRGGSAKGWTLQMAMDYPSYLWFERNVWKRFRQDLLSGRFDIVHRITPMSPTLPSYLAHVCPVPFVLGPLNGNLPWPVQFRAELAREGEWLSFLRNFYKVMPYHRSTYARAKCILAAFSHTIGDLDRRFEQKTINFPEVGIDPELFSSSQRDPDGKLEVLFAGRLVPYKLAEVVVRAFASSPILRQHTLSIVGDGPERSRLEAIVAAEGLNDCVHLLGQCSQAEVAGHMRRAPIFAFPSIRELGAGVVVEAMASGMACVVVDYGGPATLIDSDRGIKVPLGSLDELVVSFRQALEALVADRDAVSRMGQSAAIHATRYYSWSRKAAKTREIYEWIMQGSKAEKPQFWQ